MPLLRPRRLFAAGLLLCAAAAVRAAPGVLPDFTGYVVDEAGVIDPQSKQQLRDLASRLDHQGIAQLAVCTVRELGDRDLREFSNDLFKKWGLGHDKKRSDGALLVLVPGPKGHRKIRLEVGYGLEGVLPDGKVGALIDQNAVPYLKQDQYGPAALAMMTAVANVLSADAAAGGDTAPAKDSPRGGRGVGMGSGARAARGGADEEAASTALGVAILSLGAVLVAQLVASSRRRFPGVRTGVAGLAALGGSVATAFALSGGAAVFVTILAGAVINLIAFGSIVSHRCPKCGKWMTIDTVVIDEPTYYSTGLAEERRACTGCSYRTTVEKVLPRRQPVTVSSGSSDDSGGGGWSSGGGDGFSGGGGGESGGGGADREV